MSLTIAFVNSLEAVQCYSYMTTKRELERKPLFRFTKVLFGLSAFIVIGLTVLIWYAVASSNVDARQAYFICNSGTTEHPLTQSEQSYIQTSKATTLAYGSDDQINTNKICYQEYSGKDPASATKSDIDFFRQMQGGINGQVYTIKNIGHDWYWNWLMGILVVEYLPFQLLRTVGLYVAGGREALSE